MTTSDINHILIDRNSDRSPGDPLRVVDYATGFYRQCTEELWFERGEMPVEARHMFSLMRYYGEMIDGGFSRFLWSGRNNIVNGHNNIDHFLHQVKQGLRSVGNPWHLAFFDRQLIQVERTPTDVLDRFLYESGYFGEHGTIKAFDAADRDFYHREKEEGLIAACSNYLITSGAFEPLAPPEISERIKAHVEAIPNYTQRLKLSRRKNAPGIADLLLELGDRRIMALHHQKKTEQMEHKINRMLGGLKAPRTAVELISGPCWMVTFRESTELVDAETGRTRVLVPHSKSRRMDQGMLKLSRRPKYFGSSTFAPIRRLMRSLLGRRRK